jgi:2'-5' RNA ligase
MGKRLFVSVDLEGMTDAVAAAQDPFADASGLSFVDPSRAHVTPKFLGDTPAGRVDELREILERAVAAADVGPFEAQFGHYGVFPRLEYVSVVWVGLRRGGEQLTRLHEAIESRTVEAGFDPAEHEFTPHVTLARMEHAGGKELVQSVVREADPDLGRLTVEEVRLTESVLHADGPRYETVAAIEL